MDTVQNQKQLMRSRLDLFTTMFRKQGSNSLGFCSGLHWHQTAVLLWSPKPPMALKHFSKISWRHKAHHIRMCQKCGRDSSKYPGWLSAEQMDDDCTSVSITPKTSKNKSKSRTLSGSQIVESVALNNVDFNRERTNKRNAPNNADFNRTRLPRKTTFVREIRWGSKIKSWKTIPRICESEF